VSLSFDCHEANAVRGTQHLFHLATQYHIPLTKGANSVCSTQHLTQSAIQYHIPVTVAKELLSAAHNIYTIPPLSASIRRL
jgi:hypothetical protein